MSRHRSAGCYGQHIRHISGDDYRISWVVDFHYATSRLRHPRTFSRLTDRAGAERFAKKWGLPSPTIPTVAGLGAMGVVNG